MRNKTSKAYFWLFELLEIRSILVFMPHSIIFENMFHLPLPILEKMARPVIVYLVLVMLLRLFGKRELARLNPFDLVILLSLPNTVQNAIHRGRQLGNRRRDRRLQPAGDNWLVVRVLFPLPAAHTLSREVAALRVEPVLNPRGNGLNPASRYFGK